MGSATFQFLSSSAASSGCSAETKRKQTIKKDNPWGEAQISLEDIHKDSALRILAPPKRPHLLMPISSRLRISTLEWGRGKGTNVQSVGRPEEGGSGSALQHQSALSDEWEHSNKAQGTGPVDPFPAFQ